MKIIFMGTPGFVTPVLESLITDDRFSVIGVYTQHPKPLGRGQRTQISCVHDMANKYKIQVYTPHSLKKSLEEQNKLLDLKPAKIVVAAYGLILPSSIVHDIPCINIHPSSLPRWRGAAPLQRAIMAGESNIDICIMKMDEKMDSGDIFLRKNFALTGKEYFEDLAKSVFIESIPLLKTVLLDYDSISPVSQSVHGITHANKVDKSEGSINWHDSSLLIERKIRALTPSPGVYFNYQGENIKIIEAEAHPAIGKLPIPGTVIDKHLNISCGTGILSPKVLQKPGKKRTSVQDFLNGYKIPVGTILI